MHWPNSSSNWENTLYGTFVTCLPRLKRLVAAQIRGLDHTVNQVPLALSATGSLLSSWSLATSLQIRFPPLRTLFLSLRTTILGHHAYLYTFILSDL